MSSTPKNNKPDQLVARLGTLWKDQQEQILVARTVQALDTRYNLSGKMATESGVEDIIQQMFGRLAEFIWRVVRHPGQKDFGYCLWFEYQQGSGLALYQHAFWRKEDRTRQQRIYRPVRAMVLSYLI
jgi:hypothetical protein